MQELESFSLVQTVRGVPSWRLSAPSARIAPSGEASLEKPVMHFFQGRQAVSADESQADSSGSARTAEVRASGDVDLLGDVVVASRVEKSTLRTEKLRYDSKRRRFHTEEPVTLERPGSVTHGRGMDADSSLNDVNIYQQETVLR